MEDFMIIAGPCAVESNEQMDEVAQGLKEMGVKFIRGGAYKPRSSPDSFQGLEGLGLNILKNIKDNYGLETVSEIMDTRDIEKFHGIDVLQVGARNMQNFKLLTECGKTLKTVLLKRGLCATIEEWIAAAKYIQKEGNDNIIMCARGIRTFDKHLRNTSDIDAIPIIKKLTDFKVIFDPSHATGNKEYIEVMSKAAIAAGADGLMVEVHPSPGDALCDKTQQLTLPEFEAFLKNIKPCIEFREKQKCFQ